MRRYRSRTGRDTTSYTNSNGLLRFYYRTEGHACMHAWEARALRCGDEISRRRCRRWMRNEVAFAGGAGVFMGVRCVMGHASSD